MQTSRLAVTRFLLATFPSVLAAQAGHGIGYTMEMSTDSGGHKTSMSMHVEILDAKFRVSIKSDMVSGTMVDMYTIIDSAAKTITSVIPSQSMASIIPASIMNQSIASPYTLDLGDHPVVEIVDLGPGETILGHATHHYRHTAAYTMKITIGGETCTKPTREVADVWTADDLKFPDMTTLMQRFTGGAASTPLAQKLDSIKRYGMKGTLLRRIGVATTTGPAGDTINVRSSFELTVLKADAVDPADFDIPAGINVMDMRERLADIDPEMMKQAMEAQQASLRETLKKSLCGGGGGEGGHERN
jgi:hypothetical protein